MFPCFRGYLMILPTTVRRETAVQMILKCLRHQILIFIIRELLVKSHYCSVRYWVVHLTKKKLATQVISASSILVPLKDHEAEAGTKKHLLV